MGSSEKYVAYHIGGTGELLVALLSQFPFESFEERDTETIGYIAEQSLTAEMKAEILEICEGRAVSCTTEVIEPQNWNAQWEASFQPVEINAFCRIRADFHEAVDGYAYDIVINPKMAFGTGHHETTWMMIDAMSTLPLKDKSVLDYGCGTGVLAILAELMGAAPIDAIDIEQESFENTKDNAVINGCTKIAAHCGELSMLAENKYDIILANINRHVLLAQAEQLHTMLENGGTLLLSGILGQDLELIEGHYTAVGFVVEEVKERGNWRCIHLSK